MDPKLLSAIGAAGAAGGSAIGVEDVFKTYVYTGNNTSGTVINNGIDISGEGGLVWIKNRDTTNAHILADTVRGASKYLSSNSDYKEASVVAYLTGANAISSFNNNGFTISDHASVNGNSNEMVSYTFRKTKKFFTCISYSGNDTARTIAHDLGSVPGFIAVKKLNNDGNWVCQHRVTGATKEGILNETGAWYANTSRWNDTNPTAEVFSVGTSDDTNGSGDDYIAYLWAHEEAEFGPNSDQSIISCGSYSGNGTSTNEVTLPFEPQFILIKESSGTGDWTIFDSMRGIATGGTDNYLHPNSNSVETTGLERIEITSTGFKLKDSGWINTSGDTYVFIAIAAETGKTINPDNITAGSDVFAMDTGNSSATIPNFDSGFAVDFAWSKLTGSSGNWWTSARLIQGRELKTNLNDGGQAGTNKVFDSNVGWHDSSAGSGYISHMWKRHAGFDCVCDLGSGSNKQVSHSLSQPAEMIFRKCRGSAKDWIVYHKDLPSSGSDLGYLYLNGDSAAGTYSPFWNQAPTATHFTVGSDNEINISNEEFINLLFSSVSGISAVGSYTGNGNALGNSPVEITTGFAPRFILIKRTDAAGNWRVFDTLRGINISSLGGANDSQMNLNDDSAADTSYNWIDVTSTGFKVTNFPSVGNSGSSYIYYSHA